MQPSIPQGMRDFGPEIMVRREWMFSTIKSVFQKYGYQPLETPTMEKLSVLTGKYGEEGDRLIFKVLNNGDFLKEIEENELVDAKSQGENGARKLISSLSERALRYDLTVPFARYVVMNHATLSYPFKRYQIQPVWRADKPQKNRYREFYQCDVDVVGTNSLLLDAEFVAIYDEVFTALGLKEVTILLNNRKILFGLSEYIGETEKFIDICVAIDKLDKIGQEGVVKELGARGVEAEKAAKLFEILSFEGSAIEKIDFLNGKFAADSEGAKGLAEMRQVLNYLDLFSIQNAKIDFNLRLARGLNYYTGTIYEVVANNCSVSSSIGGGGRYDNLTGVFGLAGISGCGVSFGADRIYDVLLELNLFPTSLKSVAEVLVVAMDETLLPFALSVLSLLRKAGVSSEIYPETAKMKKILGYADKKGINYALIIGSDEAAEQKVQFKNLSDGTQEKLSAEELVKKLRG